MSLTPGTEMQVKTNLNDKPAKNGDEQIEGMSLAVSDMSEFSDPAILVVREILRYTKEQLITLRDAPLSQKKPDFLDTSTVSPSIWDPERWNFDRKKSDTPTENGPRAGDGMDTRRRPGDPRERIRKENDGIVLSPQRRSFNSGCFVPVRETTSRAPRPHSPLGKPEAPHIGVREIQPGNRRIGSGRILRDWDFGEKTEGDNEYNFRGQPRNNDRDEKFNERRSFGRDFDMGRDKEKETGRRNGRYDRRRISEKDEEPEWFSGGPSSQNDTIELRGFDESDKPGSKKKLSPSRTKRAKEWSKKKVDHSSNGAQIQNSSTNNSDEKEDLSGSNNNNNNSKKIPGGSKPASNNPLVGHSGAGSEQKGKRPPLEQQQSQTSQGEGDKQAVSSNDPAFNFDDIFNSETIPGLLSNGVGAEGDAAKSRFSRWFKRESPDKIENSRRSSMQDDNHLMKDLLNEISETNVSIPGDSESYFAPISPAANTGRTAHQNSSKSINIMEMLQRGKQQHGQGDSGDVASIKQQMQGKILSLDELEAKMRQTVDLSSGNMQNKQQPKPNEEMAAFKRLLAQASGGHNVTTNGPKTQPMSLLEMLSHSQQQDEARLANSSHLLSPSSPNMNNLHHHHPNDMTLKLQQAQQQQKQMEMLSKLMNAGINPQHIRASPLHDMGVQQSRELLNRPEAQAILQGLKRGDITPQHLYQQLSNPALQPRHRDMLLTILKMQGGGGGIGPSPRVLSPVPPHAMFPPQQQLRISPLPPNAYCVSPILATSPNTLTVPAMHQRIPSPRELQVHTQNILQRALIKKKLEEQQENYRKKQELQRGASPNPNNNQGSAKSVSSPTPLAFTPTSVLRKMTADKDEGKENKTVSDGKIQPQGRPLTGMRPQAQPQPQWNPQYSSKQPGRPIVKANSNFQSGQSQAEQFFANHQQQRLYNQQPLTNQQQRKLSMQNQQPPLTPTSAGGQYGPPSSSSQSVVPPGVSHHGPNQYNHTNQSFAPPPQLTQQQLRAQHQQHARPSTQSQQPQQGAPSSSSHLPHQLTQHPQLGGFQQNQQGGAQQQPMGAAWQQFLSSTNTRNNNQMGRGGTLNDVGGDLSPTTTNQLARWFSPDLLERARGGELPSTAGLAQHALSLEEIERQTAPPVHN